MNIKNKINIFLYNNILHVLNISAYLTKRLIGKKIFEKRIIFDFERTFDSNFALNKKFKFIQIGGNDGVSFDTIYNKITSRDSKGIILEPSPKYFEQLKVNYKKFKFIHLLPYAIFEKSGVTELYELNEEGLKNHPSWAAGIGSLDMDHLIKLNVKPNEINKIKVKVITFNELIELNPEFNDIDYLQIDTEGYDYKILKSIDFQKFNANIIKFEFKNLSDLEQKQAIAIFKENYNIYKDELDLVCLKKYMNVKCRI